MPVKFKETTKDREGNVQNYYMRSTSTAALLAALDNNNTQPKQKQKIRNELVRRSNA